MLAYNNDESLKQSILAEMAGHREADRLVQGHGYWEDGKGCAVGCLIKSGDHREYETRFGIPCALAFLEDRIFEGLPEAEAQIWPERFLNAIPTGADLSMVVSKLMYWLMTDPDGIRKHARPDELKAIEAIAELYKNRLHGKEPSIENWLSARNAAAYDVAAYAAYAAAYYAYYAAADAAYYAAAAAYYAADTAAYAADAAAYAADADVARKTSFVRIADKLIEILESKD